MALALPLPAAARLFTRRLALSRTAEAVLVLALVGLAAALRWPELFQIPELTDETAEVWLAFEIFRGRALPLTNITTFVGPLWNYLVAGLFALAGPSPFSPRALIMAIGALTVVPTYLLGRELGGPRAGLVAAGLLAANGGHIASNSHVGYSSCTIPLFATTCFWLMVRAVKGRSGPAFVGGAFAAGLGALVHSTFWFLVPGLGVYLLWKGWPLVRSRWLPAALFAFMLGYSPLIYFNLTTGFYSISEALSHEDAAAVSEQAASQPFVRRYLDRLDATYVSALRIVSGAIDVREGSTLRYWLDPRTWPYALLAVAGLVATWRAGQPLPALVVGGALLIWPSLHVGVENLPTQARYLMPMFPPLFAAMAYLLVRLCERAGPWQPAAWLAVLALVLYPQMPLYAYYAQQRAIDKVNEVGYVVLRAVQRNQRGDERIMVDPGVDRWSFGGNGGGQRAFRYLFWLSGYRTIQVIPERELSQFVDCGESSFYVLRAIDFRKLPDQAAALQRKGISLSPVLAPGPESPIFGLYRLEREPCPGQLSSREEAARRDARASRDDRSRDEPAPSRSR